MKNLIKITTISMLMLSIGNAAAAVTKNTVAKRVTSSSSSASFKLAKITNTTSSPVKVTFSTDGTKFSHTIPATDGTKFSHTIPATDGTKFSHTIPAHDSQAVEGTPSLSFVSNINVDLTPERRYITAPKQSDTWNKMFSEKLSQLKEKLTKGDYGVELKITGPDSLELVKVPLAMTIK